MKLVSAIVLAAGFGSRARSFKPLLNWNGETFISKVIRCLKDSAAFSEILVVTGYQSELLSETLSNHGVSGARNDHFTDGMHSSIKTGLYSLRKPWDGVLIAQVDQPLLDSEDYYRIASEWSKSSFSLARPIFNGQPGNPAILGREHREEIQSHPDGDHGCSYLFKKFPEKTLFVEMQNDHCLIDFDHLPDDREVSSEVSSRTTSAES